MYLELLRKNLKEITLENGYKVLISYRKPVAILTDYGKAIVTEKFFSRTTNEHISYWLNYHDVENNPDTVPQKAIEQIAG